MTREIITAQTVNQAKIRKENLARKIAESRDNVKTFVLNDDLSDADIQAAQALRINSKAIQSAVATSGSIVSSILDEDMTPAQIAEVKEYRLQSLEGKLSDTEEVKKDEWIDKLIKYIPTEIIAFYITLTSIVSMDASDLKSAYAWGVMAAGVIITVVYLKVYWKVPSNLQVFLSTIAFFVWAISLDSSLDDYLKIPDTLKALILPVVTFVLPLIDPPPVQTNEAA